MKKSTKIALTVALCCIGLGSILGLYTIYIQGFNWNNFPAEIADPVSKTVPVTEEFRNIKIEDIHCDIRFLPASGQECSVVCTDSASYFHQIEVRDMTLYITAEDTGRLFSAEADMEITVYLPNTDIDSLYLETVSGDVELLQDFTFRTAELTGISGTLRFSGNIQEKLRINTVSGDIILKNMEIPGEMHLKTVSGSIRLDHVDAPYAKIQSISGDVTCRTPSEKCFITSTVSGSVRTADTPDSNKNWEITTTSGNIDASVSD